VPQRTREEGACSIVVLVPRLDAGGRSWRDLQDRSELLAWEVLASGAWCFTRLALWSQYDTENFRCLDMPTHEELKSMGLKATLPRQRILAAFQSGRMRHMSAEDVVQALRAEDIALGLGTVYRVLLQFEQAGLLRRANIDAARAVFELEEGEHHDHLLCLDCGRVEEFFHPEIERLQSLIAQERGFRLEQHSLSLHGRCTRNPCEHRRSVKPL